MAVTDCRIERSIAASIDNRNRGTYNARYRVLTNSNMGAKQVLNGCLAANLAANGVDGNPNHPIPNIGASYDLTGMYGSGEADPYSYALSYACAPEDDSHRLYHIDVTWTPVEPGEDPNSRTITVPTNRGARFHWDTETVLKIADRDRSNQPVTNGAGRSFDRPVQLEKDRPLLVARFNVGSLSTAVELTQTYAQAVNSTAWTYISPNPAARTVVCRSARSGELTTEGNVSFYPMEFVFAFAESGETWDEKILNEGYGHYVIADNQTYGYGFATSDYTTSTDPIPLSDSVIIVNNNSATAPTSVPQPATPISGKAGDQIPFLLTLAPSTWAISEPDRKSRANGEPIYQTARELDEAGAETTDKVTEPVLLYANGCRLPEGMVGNYITKRLRREVNFNNLNAYLTATP